MVTKKIPFQSGKLFFPIFPSLSLQSNNEIPNERNVLRKIGNLQNVSKFREIYSNSLVKNTLNSHL